MQKSAIIFILILSFSFASAIEVPNYEDRYVNDFANTLTPEDSDTLRAAFEIVEENTTAQIVFVSINTIEEATPSDFAMAIGEKWGVGQSTNSNGMVMLYVKDVNKFWVSAGYGLEGVLPDSKIGRFLDDYYVPLKSEGNISEGITLFSLAISQELIEHNAEITAPNKPSNKTKIFVIIVIIILLLLLFSRARRYTALAPIFIPHGGSHTSGGGFGGGHFGGGGAGR